MFNSTTSETITATKMKMTSRNENIEGCMIPFLAISIMPLLVVAPRKMPVPATIMMVLKVATLAPTAEFRKLTASLLTPTTKSKTASISRKITSPK